MINNFDQYEQAVAAVHKLETALSSLRSRIEPVNPELFKAMAQSYLKEIKEIRLEIDEYIGLNVASEYGAPLWFALFGENLSVQEISTRLLADWLSKFRRALQNVSEFLETGKIISGRPSMRLLDKTDPKIVSLQPGSIKIGLKLPVPEEQWNLFLDNSNPSKPLSHKALDRLLQLVAWIDSEEDSFSYDQFPDENETIVLVNQILSLVPSNRSSVNRISFSGELVPSSKSLYLTVRSREKVNKLLAELSTTYEDSVEGVIREIDLDAQRIILRERGADAPDVKCYLPDELIEIAEGLLDSFVRVYGRISSITPDVINAMSIEKIYHP